MGLLQLGLGSCVSGGPLDAEKTGALRGNRERAVISLQMEEASTLLGRQVCTRQVLDKHSPLKQSGRDSERRGSQPLNVLVSHGQAAKGRW